MDPGPKYLKMIRFLRQLLGSKKNKSGPGRCEIDIPALIEKVKTREENAEISLGRKIYALDYEGLEVRLDRDITKNYRVTVYNGKERRYSFTVYARKGEYEKLSEGFERIFNFLQSEARLSDLPNDILVKGFYYGNTV